MVKHFCLTLSRAHVLHGAPPGTGSDRLCVNLGEISARLREYADGGYDEAADEDALSDRWRTRQ